MLGAEPLTLPLPVKNYDDLRNTHSTALHFLVVLVLDEADTEWLTSSEDALLIRRCAYWYDLNGYPPTENESTVDVRLPRAQVFDVAALQAMIHKADERIVPVGEKQ